MLDFNQIHRQKLEQDLEHSSITIMLILSSLIMATAAQIIYWDKYALDVLPILTKELVSMTSPQDWEDKAKMCWDLRKWDCVEAEYAKAAHHDSSKYARLGQYQMRRLKFDKAARSFAIYFKTGAEDPEVAGAYANALAQTNQFDEASKYFNKVLGARPEMLQVPVVRNFIAMLIKHEKFEHARRLIEEVRSQYPTGEQFMDSEYKRITKLQTAAR